MSLEKEIRRLIYERKKCKICPLHRSKSVISKGEKDCDILFLGLNPGKTEVELNKPFVGRAGKKLDQLIRASGLDELKLAFTNCILCYTNNEKEIPNVSECVENCRFLVNKIIKYYSPKIIIPLGNGAIKFFNLEGSITKLQGQVFGNVIPIMHPSSALYTPENQQIIIRNLLKVKDIYERIRQRGLYRS